MEIRYYFKGIQVPREGAYKAWLASKTYKRARFADAIFTNAEHGREDGGASNHLREANIRIELLDKDPQCPTP